MTKIRTGALLWALLAVACGDDASTDAGPGTDAGAAMDAGGGDTDAGGMGTDASVDAATTAADGGTEVARCQASSAALAAACPGDGNRTCHAGAYASYCVPGARVDLLADGLDCLLAMSGASGCRTFSDPSGADVCVDGVFAAASDATVTAIVTRITGLCGDDSIDPVRTEPPLYVLTASQLEALQSCVDAAADCAATEPCSAAFQTPIAACYP